MSVRPLRSRFDKETDRSVQQYTESISFDRRLYRYDIQGSIAHARMLGKQGIIPAQDAEAIIAGLAEIGDEIEQGKLELDPALEDIHMNIEARLAQKIGEPAGKLHTARSRNDQIALDMRLFTRDAIRETLRRINGLQRCLVEVAAANKDMIIPGYTHLQRAQPVLLAHHLLAYFEMLQRDAGRFRDCLRRADVMPLGSGALAGSPYPLDRAAVAAELGFSEVSRNSLDAVSDRDFVIEYEAAAAITAMHLSRLAEEIVLWSSAEFGFIQLDDAYATGSSLMPQKKNPDVAELARGKTGRVYGRLVAMLTTMKALPLSYNRDLQEDKEGFFDAVDTLLATLEVFRGMIGTLRVDSARVAQAVGQDYFLATDVADYLVKKGMPFRQAYSTVGELVKYALSQGKGLHEVSIERYRALSPLFDEQVYSITARSAVAARNVPGGTAPQQVEAALAAAGRTVQEDARKLEG